MEMSMPPAGGHWRCLEADLIPSRPAGRVGRQNLVNRTRNKLSESRIGLAAIPSQAILGGMLSARRIVWLLVLLLLMEMAPLHGASATVAVPDAGATVLNDRAPDQVFCDKLATVQPNCFQTCFPARIAPVDDRRAAPLLPDFDRAPDERLTGLSARPDPKPPRLNSIA